MLSQVTCVHMELVAQTLLGGLRVRPPRRPPIADGQGFRDDHVAFLCVRNQVLRSNLALELRSQGYQVLEGEDAEDLLLYTGVMPAEVVFSDSLHVISRARRLVSEKHTSLCAVMLRDDPYCEVDAFMMGATDVIRRG